MEKEQTLSVGFLTLGGALVVSYLDNDLARAKLEDAV